MHGILFKKKYHHIGSVNISVYKKNSELVVCVFVYNRAGKPLVHVPKIAHRKISLACGIHCCPNFLLFLLPDQHLDILKKCVYIHIPDCIETVYKLLLLPDNTTRETFLHKLGAVLSVDWIFIIGALL
jgi:hypothetical protein